MVVEVNGISIPRRHPKGAVQAARGVDEGCGLRCDAGPEALPGRAGAARGEARRYFCDHHELVRRTPPPDADESLRRAPNSVPGALINESNWLDSSHLGHLLIVAIPEVGGFHHWYERRAA